jgi:hypothetical protein
VIYKSHNFKEKNSNKIKAITELAIKIENLGLPEFSVNTLEMLQKEDFWVNSLFETAKHVFITELAEFYLKFEQENSVKLQRSSYEFICRLVLKKYPCFSASVDAVVQKSNKMIIQGIVERTRVINSWVRDKCFDIWLII